MALLITVLAVIVIVGAIAKFAHKSPFVNGSIEWGELNRGRKKKGNNILG
jgi:hypothetical protein